MEELQQLNGFREKLIGDKTFRLSVIVFIAHLIVFFFIELKSLRSGSFMSSFITTIMLASMVLITGILTAIPQFTLYVGRTQIIFSSMILLTKLVELLAGQFGIFSMVEVLIGFASFLYGYELVKRFRRAVPAPQPQIVHGN